MGMECGIEDDGKRIKIVIMYLRQSRRLDL